MARLIARPAVAGGLPLELGATRLTAPEVGAITVIAPYAGAGAALSRALTAAHGLTFPAPNRVVAHAGARLVWSGRGQALLLGPSPGPGLAAHAALVDQSDGWAVFGLGGAGARAVLARLTPLDLRADVFGPGQTARTQLGHMAAAITRRGDDGYEIMVFRSMARTALEDLEQAMKSVAARGERENFSRKIFL
ncbi:sarcosine oxidase subunit gamma [Actibacterium sp. D379-3]